MPRRCLPLLLLAAASAAAQPPAVPALLEHYGCTLCHAEREPMAGPSWGEIAAKYREHPRAAAAVVEVVRKGKHGDALWPMPPLPEVTDADAKRIARYILEMTP